MLEDFTSDEHLQELCEMAVSGDISAQEILLRSLRTLDSSLRPFYEFLDKIQPKLIPAHSSLQSLPMVDRSDLRTSELGDSKAMVLPFRVQFAQDELYDCLLFLMKRLSQRIYIPVHILYDSSQHILIECYHHSLHLLFPQHLLHLPTSTLTIQQLTNDHSSTGLYRLLSLLLKPSSPSHPKYFFLDSRLPRNLFDNTDDLQHIAFSLQYTFSRLQETSMLSPYHPDAMTHSGDCLISLIRLQLLANNTFPKVCLVVFLALSGEPLGLSSEAALSVMHVCLGGLVGLWTSGLEVKWIVEVCSTALRGNSQSMLQNCIGDIDMSIHDKILLARLLVSAITYLVIKSAIGSATEFLSVLLHVVNISIRDQKCLGEAGTDSFNISALLDERDFVCETASENFLSNVCGGNVTLESLRTWWKRSMLECLGREILSHIDVDDANDIKLRVVG